MTFGGSLQGALADAARAVADVARGRSLSVVLDHAAGPATEPGPMAARPSRAALLDIAHGTLRGYGRMPAITRHLARRGATVDPLVESLLWCALYAIDDGRHAAYTVVDQAVRASAAIGRPAAKGYVNAVLRRYLRERAAIESALASDPEFRWQHPRWWIDAVRAAYPDAWEGVLAAANARPPMTLRVNRRRSSVRGYLARLEAAGIVAREAGESAIRLARPLPVDRLPGFADGDVSVQDAGAQLAAARLEAAAGMRVLDACAAPGGKCAHVLEGAAVAMTALDADANRCRLVAANLARLGLEADVRHADCTDLGAWWDGTPFDRVIADVPCTASGVARRHPDIKWLRRASDVATFATRQSRILDALWQVLAPGGRLLYVTCSVFPGENSSVVDAFCRRTPTAHRLPLPDGAAPQLLPAEGHDGFHYALLGRGA